MGLTADNSQVTLQLKISKNSSYMQMWCRRSDASADLAPERHQPEAVRVPNDDYAGQSSDISVTNPQYAVVAVGW